MKKQASLVDCTIRGVPREGNLILEQEAAKPKVSLNQKLVEELSEATSGAKIRADFSDLVGKWTSDPAFNEVLSAGRKIDQSKWKC